MNRTAVVVIAALALCGCGDDDAVTVVTQPRPSDCADAAIAASGAPYETEADCVNAYGTVFTHGNLTGSTTP